MNDVPVENGKWRRRLKLGLIGFALVGGFFLLVEHRAHALPYLPWLFLLACPLLHVFMHGGHHHGGHGPSPDDKAGRRP